MGAALGWRLFVEDFISAKVQSWSGELSSLSMIAMTHPHVAYAFFSHGLPSHWNYVFRTVRDIFRFASTLEDSFLFLYPLQALQ